MRTQNDVWSTTVVVQYLSSETDGVQLRFWNGRRWVSEVPDAFEYHTLPSARRAARVAAIGEPADSVEVIERYGMSDERSHRIAV